MGNNTASPAHLLFNEWSIRVFLITLVELNRVEKTMDQKGIPQGPRWSDVPDHGDTPTPVLNQKCIRKCVQHMYTRNTRES